MRNSSNSQKQIAKKLLRQDDLCLNQHIAPEGMNTSNSTSVDAESATHALTNTSGISENWVELVAKQSGIKPYYSHGGQTIFCCDCRDILPHLPKVDLVLTDPPYGIGADKPRGNTGRNGHIRQRNYPETNWDTAPPSKDIIDLIVSHGNKSVIWGGNYFELPPTPSVFVWDKDNGTNRYADCELAWSNHGGAARLIKWKWHGFLQEPGHEKDDRKHPTQKPLKLMTWCLGFFPDAKTILDPFMGSGTTLVAAKQLGRQAIGIEIDERYCAIAAMRLSQDLLPFGGDE